MNIPVPVENSNVTPVLNHFIQLEVREATSKCQRTDKKGSPDDYTSDYSFYSSDSKSTSGSLDSDCDVNIDDFVPEGITDESEAVARGVTRRLVAEDPELLVVPGALLVYESKVHGSPTNDRKFTAHLKTHDGLLEHKEPLFQWMHVQRERMVFDEFQKLVCDNPNLTTSEKRELEHLLTKTKTDYTRERQRCDGSPINHLQTKTFSRRLGAEGDARATSGKHVVWGCVPYVVSRKYDEDRIPTDGSYPVQTLIQVGSAGASKKRDLEQAICSLVPNQCLHVPQLWVLVLDNTLYTYGEIDRKDLIGEFATLEKIHHNSPPKRNQEDTLRQSSTHIFVSYRGCWLWEIDLEACQCWFDFLSFFREFLPARLEFSYHGEDITSRNWPEIWSLARDSNKNTVIEFFPRSLQNPNQRGILKPLSSTPSDKLRIHLLEIGRHGLAGFSTNMNRLNDVLFTKAKLSHRTAYTRGRTATREEVYTFISNQTELLTADGTRPDTTSDFRRSSTRLEACINLFNTVDLLFGTFFPLNSNTLITRKFRGAVHALIKQHVSSDHEDGREPTLPDIDLSKFSDTLWNFTKLLLSINEYLSAAGTTKLEQISQTKAFFDGWVEVLLLMIHSSRKKSKTKDYIKNARSKVVKGFTTISQLLSTNSLSGKEVLLPLDLASILIFNLASDRITEIGGKHQTTTNAYNQAVQLLEDQVSTQKFNRTLDRKATYLKNEIEIIYRKVVDGQLRWFEPLERIARDGNVPDSVEQRHQTHWEGDYEIRRKLLTMAHHALPHPPTVYGNDEPVILGSEPLNPEGFKGEMASRAKRSLQNKMQNLEDIQDRAESVRFDNINALDDTKDRQERLIYIFTIVTVIFLPLSSVAAIFGMNTADIRDLDWNQGLFWAVALPLTALVLLLAFCWPDRFPSLRSWIQSGPPSGRKELIH